MPLEFIIHNATYLPEQKKLEIIVALVDSRILAQTVTVVDKDTGAQVQQATSEVKEILKAFGETLNCADRPGHAHDPSGCMKTTIVGMAPTLVCTDPAGHAHDPAACMAAHPDYAKVDALLADRMTQWKAVPKTVDMTPAVRKIK